MVGPGTEVRKCVSAKVRKWIAARSGVRVADRAPPSPTLPHNCVEEGDGPAECRPDAKFSPSLRGAGEGAGCCRRDPASAHEPPFSPLPRSLRERGRG